jgi:tRNA(Met) C34 N-acetyltransferase TmcA
MHGLIIYRVSQAADFCLFYLLCQSYEGTGRSLSLKLLQQLEEQSRAPVTGVEGSLSGIYYYILLSLLACGNLDIFFL